MRRIRTGGSVALTLAALCLTTGGWAARPADAAGLARVTGHQSPLGTLFAVAGNSAKSAWAVGTTPDAQPLIERWNGGSWRPVAGLDRLSGVLVGVAVVSGHFALAVGSTRSQRLVSELWNGTSWRRPPGLAGHSGALTSVAALSSRDAWAVGSTRARRPLIEHWNGLTWSSVAGLSQVDGSLSSVTAVSAKDVWAVGTTTQSGTEQALVEHWNGVSWQQQSWPAALGVSELTGIAAVNGHDIWVVGRAGAVAKATLHWNGSAWTRVPAPCRRRCDLLGIAAGPDRRIWAVGSAITGRFRRTPVILKWTGTDWVNTPIPAPPARGGYLFGVAILSARAAVAVGAVAGSAPSGPQQIIDQWNGAAWRPAATSVLIRAGR